MSRGPLKAETGSIPQGAPTISMIRRYSELLRRRVFNFPQRLFHQGAQVLCISYGRSSEYGGLIF